MDEILETLSFIESISEIFLSDNELLDDRKRLKKFKKHFDNKNFEKIINEEYQDEILDIL